MITQGQEYYARLAEIQDNNTPSKAILIPGTERVYEVNLETRVIESPQYVIIKSDHKAETIYFKVPRYYDNIDLYTLVCVIQYINANNEEYVYAVPYYDIDTYANYSADGTEEPMILFPWMLSKNVSAKLGTVKFSIRFFKLDITGTYLLYNINTLSNTLTVQTDIGFTPEDLATQDDYGMIETLDTTPQSGKTYYVASKSGTTTIYEKINVTSFASGVVYYEKVNYMGYLRNDYQAFLENCAKAANEGSLTWIVLS